jgi:hypothetical protein
MSRRIDVEADDFFELSAKLGSLESLNDRTRCGCSPCLVQMRRTEDGLIPTALAIAALQWVARSWRGAAADAAQKGSARSLQVCV